MIRLSACILAASIGALCPLPAAAATGFQRLTIANPGGPPIEAGVWYPADDAAGVAPKATPMGLVSANVPAQGRALPLVVISHGLGGGFTNHHQTAEALVGAGFVVAALTHTGDNWRKPPMTAGDATLRPRELKLLVDYMLEGWRDHERLDPTRIGAFGFSLGGFTVLTAAGGAPDLNAISGYCETRPEQYTCRVRTVGAPSTTAPRTWTHDTRIKAVVAAAPALAFTFGRNGLRNVTQPVQLWQAEHDDIVPRTESANTGLPPATESHQVRGAGHFDFFAPCDAQLARHAPAVCESAAGFDRAAFHADFNREVVRFFREALGR